MSKPFSQLIAERAKLPPDVVTREAYARMTKWASVSSGKLVSLDEAAWLACVLFMANEHNRKAQEQAHRVKKQMEESVRRTNSARVHTVVMSDASPTSDGAG